MSTVNLQVIVEDPDQGVQVHLRFTPDGQLAAVRVAPLAGLLSVEQLRHLRWGTILRDARKAKEDLLTSLREHPIADRHAAIFAKERGRYRHPEVALAEVASKYVDLVGMSDRI